MSNRRENLEPVIAPETIESFEALKRVHESVTEDQVKKIPQPSRSHPRGTLFDVEAGNPGSGANIIEINSNDT